MSASIQIRLRPFDVVMLDERDTQALLLELANIARPNADFNTDGPAAHLALRDGHTYRPSDEECRALSRALDHLAYLESSSRQLAELELSINVLLRHKSRAYRVKTGGKDLLNHVSHSGLYERDDRLVIGPGSEWYVQDVQSDVVYVTPWDRSPNHQLARSSRAVHSRIEKELEKQSSTPD